MDPNTQPQSEPQQVNQPTNPPATVPAPTAVPVSPTPPQPVETPQVAPAAPTDGASPQPVLPPKKKGSGLKIVLIIAGVLVIVLLLIAAGLVVMKKMQKSNTKTTPSTQQTNTSSDSKTYENSCMSFAGPPENSDFAVKNDTTKCTFDITNSGDPNLNIHMLVVKENATIESAAQSLKAAAEKGAKTNPNIKLVSEKNVTVDGQPAIQVVSKDSDGITLIDTFIKPKKSYSTLGSNAGHIFWLTGYAFREDQVQNYDTVLNSIQWK